MNVTALCKYILYAVTNTSLELLTQHSSGQSSSYLITRLATCPGSRFEFLLSTRSFPFPVPDLKVEISTS